MSKRTRSAEPIKFKLIQGAAPARKITRNDRCAELYKALGELPMAGAVEHLGQESGWRTVYIRWARQNNCRLDCYETEDARRIVVKVGGEPKARRRDALKLPPPPRHVEGMARPLPPVAPPDLPRGLSPDQVNPDAKPHQGKRVRAESLIRK